MFRRGVNSSSWGQDKLPEKKNLLPSGPTFAEAMVGKQDSVISARRPLAEAYNYPLVLKETICQKQGIMY